MTVTVWIDGVLEPERVEGSLRDFAEALNLATAQGREYAILPGVGGKVMVQTRLISTAREEDTEMIGGWDA